MQSNVSVHTHYVSMNQWITGKKKLHRHWHSSILTSDTLMFYKQKNQDLFRIHTDIIGAMQHGNNAFSFSTFVGLWGFLWSICYDMQYVWQMSNAGCYKGAQACRAGARTCTSAVKCLRKLISYCSCPRTPSAKLHVQMAALITDSQLLF